ncbi:PKD domain-containing protein [Halosegnis longus]|uniref:PKD domain-containing protein n=1 Tax=Halosegnis longus TaxID=2216012 RepID=UPI00096A71F3|nr:PKD domain-containing protein [Salella cibi]
MAVVSERGQQLLIGGLVLAIALTALVVVLNGALYTDDLRTRDAAGQTLAADDYEGELSRELGRTLDRINDGREGDRTVVEQAVLDATFATNDLLGRQYASGQAAYASVDPARIERGIIIEQDASCAFTALNTNCGGSGERPVTPRFTYGDDDDDSWVQAGDSGENLILDASTTEDYDETSGDLSYDWTLTEGTDTITKSGETPSGFTLPESGFWKVTLTVTDTDTGATETVTAWVAAHATDDANEVPPRARFTHSPTVPVATEQVVLDATATTDGNGDITSYDWWIKAPDGTVLPSPPDGETTTFTPADAGDYVVALDVSDATGNTDTLRKTVTVDETLANGGGRTGDTDGDGTNEPPFRVAPVSGDRYFALGEAGATPDSPDWTLAESATVRQFELETNDIDALHDVSDSSSDDPTALADTFHVELTGQDGDTWAVHVFESSTSGQFTVATIAPDGTVDIRHRSNDPIAVDVTTGEVNGRQVFPFAPELAQPADIAFRNGDQIAGSYELTLATGTSASTDVQTANFYPASGDRQPYAAPAVYAVNVPATYDTAELSRRGSVRVAPDEPTVYGRGISLGVPEPSYTDRDAVVYVAPDGGANTLRSITPDGTVTTYDATDVQAIGPKQVDIDADDVAEIPYVAGDGSLRIVDANGEKQTLVSASAPEAPDTTQALIGIDRWNGQFSVLYATANGNAYRVDAAGNTAQIGLDPGGNGVGAIGGVTDMDDDGTPDILFADTSQQLRFYEEGASDNVLVSNGGVGQNAGIGMGAARDFDRDGVERAPIVDGSGSLRLISETTGRSGQLTSVSQKAPAAGFQWDEATTNREIMFVAQDTNDAGNTIYVLAYVPPDGSEPATIVTDSNGDPIQVVQGTGVA